MLLNINPSSVNDLKAEFVYFVKMIRIKAVRGCYTVLKHLHLMFLHAGTHL